jgi:hypothetical protein
LNLDYFTHHATGISMTWQEGAPVVQPFHSRQLEQLLVDSDRGEWSESATQQVLQYLQKIQQLGAAAGAMHTGQPGTVRPETELNQLTGLFHAMLAKIARLEKGAQEARDRLLPQVNVGVRSLQMRRAYSGGAQ